MSRMKLSYMAPSWKTPLKDMRPGLPGQPRAGRRCPMNMPEHLECSDESLNRLYRSPLTLALYRFFPIDSILPHLFPLNVKAINGDGRESMCAEACGSEELARASR